MLKQIKLLGSTLIEIVIIAPLAIACAPASEDGNRGQFAPSVEDETTVIVENASTTSSTSTTSAVTCSATLDKNVLSPGEAVAVTVTASGGVSPYYLNVSENMSLFTSTKTISGAFNNDTGVNRIVEKQFYVIDSQGSSGLCYFRLTVLPRGNASTGNMCVLTATPSLPSVNQFMELKLTPQFQGSYVLRNLQLQNDISGNWTIYPNTTNSSPLAYQVQYRTRGAKTISATIEVSGVQYSCSTSVTVF